MSKQLSRRLAARHQAVTPGGRGRFRDFDVLREVDRWDLVTAGAVLARLEPDPQLRFFSRSEEAAARTLLDLLLSQQDDPKVPVAELVDERLASGETDGWRYEDMPEDGEAWRRSLAALDAEAQDRHGSLFATLSRQQQGTIVQAVQDAEEWRGFNTKHLWSLWTRYACAAFYSHPWAWNEIGFGGPAYPRGYKNRGIDARERWERQEEDAADPVPWASRTEEARKAHAERAGTGGAGDEAPPTTIIGSDGKQP